MKDLVKILNCPICKNSEELEIVEKRKVERRNDEVLIEGIIACKGSARHKFAVRHGMVVFWDPLLPELSDEEIEKALSQ